MAVPLARRGSSGFLLNTDTQGWEVEEEEGLDGIK
jgi:hypothetical protein